MRNKVSALLAETGKFLCAYLNNTLPMSKENWWNESVVNCLTFSQKRNVEQKRITSLEGFDLASLIRVLDQNWYLISKDKSFLPEARNYIKEMQTVRNRWAHASIAELSDDDVYRDVDTIQRFALILEAPQAFIDDVRLLKKEIVLDKSAVNAIPENNKTKDNKETEFSIGDIVALSSDPSKQGAITAIKSGTPENRYSVFQDGTIKTYYASQLQAIPKQSPDFDILDLSEFHAHMTALQICHPGLSTLYSLNAARINFIPYQFRPVLKFIRSDRPRMLIADGVGVGKTIEAGLILRELQARRDVKSVLIICPRPLVTEKKWQNEMKRFDERFTHLDGNTLRYCIAEMNIDGEWPDEHNKTIIPFSLFDETLLQGRVSSEGRKRNVGLMDLDPPPRFDLVIVDEAHHIKNTDTYTHSGVRFFCENAEAVLFLTATPIQLGSHDLFVLLNVLRPDLVIDVESFEHMAAPNPFINKAIDCVRSCIDGWKDEARQNLEEAAATPWGQSILQGNPDFQRVYDLLNETDLSDNDRVSCINALEDMHTFSSVINRTRRRDIGEFTTRRPETITIDFTTQQKQLHDDILQLQAIVLARLHGDRNVRFMMTTIRRRAASSLYGLIPFLNDVLNRRIDDLMLAESDDDIDRPDNKFVQKIEAQIRSILVQAENLDPYDSKLESLRKIIREKQELKNNKIMVFSSFRHTLAYLFDDLDKDGFRVGLVHGDVPDEERMYLRKKFALSKDENDALDVLLFSEVGCEGLDYQFCDCIVNYDLPWNPMKIEQRIGRIDRNGQRSETVSIFNLITPGTVDADIYERCLMRIGVFNKSIGSGEEILGEISREVRNVAENIELTDDERREKFQQIADNQIRLINEQEKLEQKQVELFGIRLPEELAKKQIEEATSFWLSSKSIHNMVLKYLEKVCGKDHDCILGDKPQKTLRLSQNFRNQLLSDFRNLPRQKSPVNRAWEKWLGGEKQSLKITFESSCALDNPDVTFIMPLHPLAKQASRMYEPQSRVATAVIVSGQNLPAGDHPFVIYQWQYQGISQDLALKAISKDTIISQNVISLLEEGKSIKLESNELPENDIYESLDSKHYKLWAEERNLYRDKTLQIADYKRESLNTSHQARIALLQEQLNQTTEEKIQRMRRAQIENANSDFERRVKELELAVNKADIAFHPVAFGIVRVV